MTLVPLVRYDFCTVSYMFLVIEILLQTFILDAREYGVKSLLDPALEETQGPSLLAVNDSVFQETDWKALQTIHGSNKTSDET